jgi:NAD(P)-dependent dehydrogenase (short-subunit alcohol dehydrogenase family)
MDRDSPFSSAHPYAGKVAIVTGASSGLGKDIATMYAEGGANVVVAARRQEPLALLVAQLTTDFGGKHLAVPTDLTKVDSIKRLFDTTIAAYGRFDIVVNNAGDAKLWPLADHTEEEIARLLDVLVVGNTYMHYYAITHFRSFIDQRTTASPCIIDILSSAGQDYYSHNGVYGPAKEYVSGLSIRNQQDNPGIAFIRLYPSNIDTPMIDATKASPMVWSFIKDAPKLDPVDIATVLGALTREGKSADVYMRQDPDGVVVARFTKKAPAHVRDPVLESYLKR